jgi:hypothetical protein
MRATVALLLVASCGARTQLGELDNVDAAPMPTPMPMPMPMPRCSDTTLSGALQITTDDQFRLFVNGSLVDQTARKWWEVQNYSVMLFRSPARKNSIAIEGSNVWSTNGTDRGVIADLRFTAGAGEQHVLTTSAWRLSTKMVSGWETLQFDASAWGKATSEGKNGIAPYGSILGSSTAEWLWSYDSNEPETMKPNAETIWIRRDFYIDASGKPSDAPGSCP